MSKSLISGIIGVILVLVTIGIVVTGCSTASIPANVSPPTPNRLGAATTAAAPAPVSPLAATRTAIKDAEYCARYQATPLPIGQVDIQGLSVTPPTGGNWLNCYSKRVQGNNGMIGFLRRPPEAPQASALTHTIAMSVAAYDISSDAKAMSSAATGKAEALLREIVYSAAGANAPERFRVQGIEVSPRSVPAPDCVRFDYSVEDRGVPGYVGKVFILDGHGIACLHPYIPGSVVMLSYSERDLEGNPRDADLKADGESFLASAEFPR